MAAPSTGRRWRATLACQTAAPSRPSTTRWGELGRQGGALVYCHTAVLLYCCCRHRWCASSRHTVCPHSLPPTAPNASHSLPTSPCSRRSRATRPPRRRPRRRPRAAPVRAPACHARHCSPLLLTAPLAGALVGAQEHARLTRRLSHPSALRRRGAADGEEGQGGGGGGRGGDAGGQRRRRRRRVEQGAGGGAGEAGGGQGGAQERELLPPAGPAGRAVHAVAARRRPVPGADSGARSLCLAHPPPAHRPLARASSSGSASASTLARRARCAAASTPRSAARRRPPTTSERGAQGRRRLISQGGRRLPPLPRSPSLPRSSSVCRPRRMQAGTCCHVAPPPCAPPYFPTLPASLLAAAVAARGGAAIPCWALD